MIRTIQYEKIPRHRNVAHLWADKQILRFFRFSFSKKHYKNLRTIYLALCEIDSDFGETVKLKGLVKTISTYAGLNRGTTTLYLHALQSAKIIDYGQEKKPDGTFGLRRLILFQWDTTLKETQRKLQIMDRILYGQLAPKEFKARLLENPLAGKPACGKTNRYKNNTSKEVLTIYKNNTSKEVLTVAPKGALESDLVSIKFANEIANIVSSNKHIHITPHKIKNWAQSIDQLIKRERIHPSRIRKALAWYKIHNKDEYVPVIESGKSLREKFIRLEDAIKRSNSNITNSPPNEPIDTNKEIEIVFTKKSAITKTLIESKLLHNITSKETLNTHCKSIRHLQILIDKKQERPDDRDVTDDYNNNTWDIIPDGERIVVLFIEWLEKQKWISQVYPSHFDIYGKTFNQFVNELHADYGLHIFTGRSLT